MYKQEKQTSLHEQRLTFFEHKLRVAKAFSEMVETQPHSKENS